MRDLISKKAKEAGIIGKADFAEHWNELSVDPSTQMTEEERRAAKVKNISLRLLNVESPGQVLDLFEDEFIQAERGEGDTTNVASVDELFMLLYFFKSQLKNLADERGQELIKNDYRVNLLVQMILDRYEPSSVEFQYQVSTVLSLSILTKFYNLELTSDQKDKLVTGLAQIDFKESSDGSFLPEIPSLVFCLHLLKTESNCEQVVKAVYNLSMVYMMAIGERIDALSVSNLLCAWKEVDLMDRTDTPFERLKTLVIEKND